MDDITIHGGDGTNSSHLVEFVGAGVDLPGEQDVEDLGEEVAPHAVHPQLEVGGHLGRHGAGLVAQAGALVGVLGWSEGWDGWVDGSMCWDARMGRSECREGWGGLREACA